MQCILEAGYWAHWKRDGRVWIPCQLQHHEADVEASLYQEAGSNRLLAHKFKVKLHAGDLNMALMQSRAQMRLCRMVPLAIAQNL